MSLRNSMLTLAIAASILAIGDAESATRRNATPVVEAQASNLTAQFDVAATQYRKAITDLEDGDESAQSRVEVADSQLKSIIELCGKTRGCQVSSMLTQYAELLTWDAFEADADTMIGENSDNGGAGVNRAVNAAIGEGTTRDAADLLSERRAKFAEMVQFNPAIQASIRKWLTDMRPSLMNSYENYQYMRQYVAPVAEQHGLPEALMFGIMAKESNGKVHVSSRAGAAGPYQFMPATGKRFGLGNDGTGFDTRFDPRQAARAAADYLTERMGELNRSIELSLAAYNGGEGRAKRVYNASGGASFWNESVYNQFPAETKDYVPMVIAAAWLYLHPREYGLYFPRVSARPATFRLEKPASIYELTVCLGNRGSRDGYFRALRNLNPRYEADAMIPAGTLLNGSTRIASLYRSYCTGGKRAELTQQLMRSNVRQAIVRVGNFQTVETGTPTETAGTTVAAAQRSTYTVQTGETLMSVSRKFQCNVSDLAKANAIATTSPLRVGQVLNIESCSAR